MVCQNCSAEVDDRAAVCPQCEAVLVDPRELKRKKSSVPKAENKYSLVSRNYNGLFNVKQASDGSFVCNCPSFLLQNGTIKGSFPFSTCKHIREYIDNSQYSVDYRGIPPSDWQMILLKTLGVNGRDMSNAQAYFTIRELMELRGISYRELTWWLKQGKKPNLLPLLHFGVELEGNIKDPGKFREQLENQGFVVAVTGYTGNTRAANEWRISDDSSVSSSSGYHSLELVSPKLFGYRDILKLKEVLSIWNKIGASYPSSAGTHIHVDGYGIDRTFNTNLAAVWAKIEIPYMWYLVSPSRRNNPYCKAITEDYLLDIYGSDRHNGRYYSLNFSSQSRHGTVEFRLFNCSTDFYKISSWVVLVLMIFDAVRKGFTYRDVPEDFDTFLDAIGFAEETASSYLSETKKYLVERYHYWKEDARQHPKHVPSVRVPVVSDVKTMASTRVLRESIQYLEKLIEYIDNGRYGFLHRDPEVLPDKYTRIFAWACGHTQKEVGMNTIHYSYDGDSMCIIVDGRKVTIVKPEPEQEDESESQRYSEASFVRLTCDCSYARKSTAWYNTCYHVRWAARWIARYIVVEKLEALRRQLEEYTGSTADINTQDITTQDMTTQDITTQDMTTQNAGNDEFRQQLREIMGESYQ